MVALQYAPGCWCVPADSPDADEQPGSPDRRESHPAVGCRNVQAFCSPRASRMVRRRQLLALAAGATLAGFGGCAEQDSEFLVTDTQLIHQEGDRAYDYPQDFLYRVSIENTGPRRQEGRVMLRLVYEPERGDSQSWSKTDTVELSRGTATRRRYVFENVFDESRDVDDYRLEAEIVQDGE